MNSEKQSNTGNKSNTGNRSGTGDKRSSAESRKLLIRRILMSVIGVLICGVSVGFFKRSEYGVDPFQSLMSGLNAVIPINFGTLYVIVCAVLIIFSLLFGRHYLGIATLVNLFLLGYVADFSLKVLTKIFPEAGPILRGVLLVIGIVAMCLSSAFYFSADLGVSVYDAVSLIVTEVWHKGVFKYNRIISDTICVAAGAALLWIGSGSVKVIFQNIGVGTIVTMFFMGPLISWFREHLTDALADPKK